MFICQSPWIKYGLLTSSLLAVGVGVPLYRAGRLEKLIAFLRFRTPMVGRLNRDIACAQVCSTLGMMLDSGLQLLPTLYLLRGTTGY